MTQMGINRFLKKWISYGVVLGLLVAGISCKKEKAEPVNPNELVRMGDELITVQDLEREFQILKNEHRPVTSERDLLEQMVEFKAQVQKARSLDLDKDPSVKRQIEKILVAALRRQQESRQDEISEADIRAVYDADIEKYTRPAMDRFAMLFLELGKSASPQKRAEVRKRMDEARVQALAQQPKDDTRRSVQGFGQLSMTCSDDPVSRYRGGDIGWSNRSMPSQRVPAAVWERGIALKKGGISEVLEMPHGLYLIKKTDFRAEKVKPFKSVCNSIRSKILAERREAAEREFVAACVKWAAPEKNETRIAQLADKPDVKTEVAGTLVPAVGVPHE